MHNSPTTFGTVTRSFHWATAILIVAAIVLGVMAQNAGFESSEALARKATLFSYHKSVGLLAFIVALARILWALTQTRPTLLNADKTGEALLAETVHWALYMSLVLVPLTGWISHAASEGFAPILWPIGQSLPFVPKSVAVSETFGMLHVFWEKILLAAVVLHVVGALKHHFIDKDATLRRMMFGTQAGSGASHPKFSWIAPPLAALVFVVVGLAGLQSAQAHHETSTAVAGSTSESEWQVQDGSLDIVVAQFGSDVTGNFANWTADVAFDPNATGKAGEVRVEIDIASLTLGGVTAEALGPSYFDATQFATATYTADLIEENGTYTAKGTVTIKGTSVPLDFPFDLSLDGNTATVSATTALNRLDFKIGEEEPTESNVGFSVGVNISLTATR